MATADVCSWVTLATNDQYAAAALVLAQSLRSVSTVHRITVLITSTVSLSLRDVIGGVFDEVVCVDVLDSRDVANLALLCRPELGVTLTKLHAWRLTHYTKCVFLDADCLVVANCDELFAREELSAAPDIGWPDCFNSGVFVFTPSFETFDALLRLVETTGSFDGGDQGLLNEYFSCWCTGPAERRLSFLYNMVVSVTYTCLPAFKRFGQDVKIVHFLGERKPWRSTHSAADDSPSSAFYQHWHQLYRQHVVPHLPHSQLPGEQQSEAQVDLLSPSIGQLTVSDEADQRERRSAWEHGQPDYMGADRFDSILAKIDQTMSRTDSQQ
nr:GYG-like protein 2 [Parasacculina yatsui]